MYVETKSFSLLWITQDSTSKQNEKIPEHSTVDIGKWETSAKFQQKIFDCMVYGTRRTIQFF